MDPRQLQGADVVSYLKCTLARVKHAQLWTPEGVARHKAKELAEAPRANLTWYLTWPLRKLFKDPGYASGVIVLYSMFSFVLLFLANLAFLACTPFLAFAASMPFGIPGAVAAGVLAMLVSVAGAIGCFLLIVGEVSFVAVGPASWKLYSLDDFLRNSRFRYTLHPEVPALVQSIKALLPDARFQVDVLVQDNFVLDPFLLVSWDNPATGITETEAALGWKHDKLLTPS